MLLYMPFSSKNLFVLFAFICLKSLVLIIYFFRKMEGNYKEAERERDELKKATQAKFGKLSNNHKAGEKMV